MKKTMALLIGALSCAAAFAAADDVRIMFSTPGPDTYADKTAVKAGERYVLVWKAAAEDRVTFAADGAVSGGKAVLVWDTTENGRCSTVLFTVSESWLAARGIAGGVWSVYLLDTRVFAEDGSYAYAAKKDGWPTLVNGSSAAVENTAGVASVVAGTVSGGTASAIPAGVDTAWISGIEVKDGNVCVTVANASPCINYTLAAGDRPDALAPGKTQAGKASGTITFVTPKTGDAQFFKVNRK